MVHSPISSFTIPSIHDDTPLECRVYHPSRFTVTKESWRKKGAIVAHPYAPLGGCYDDPVVQVAVAEILKKGFVVGTFNLRSLSLLRSSFVLIADLSVEVLVLQRAALVGRRNLSCQTTFRLLDSSYIISTDSIQIWLSLLRRTLVLATGALFHRYSLLHNNIPILWILALQA